jgi:RecJ-like exonuclease
MQLESSQNSENSDVDVSLIEINLALTYEQRIQKHEEARQLMEDLLTAGRVLRNETPR